MDSGRANEVLRGVGVFHLSIILEVQHPSRSLEDSPGSCVNCGASLMSFCILPALSDEGVLQSGYRNSTRNACKQELMTKILQESH